MSEAVKGRSLENIETLFDAFHGAVTNTCDPGALETLGKLAVFGGVAEFPMRVKCATLPWHTLKAALHGETTAAKTE